MIEFERSIVIERPREEVFRFVADPANDPKWKSSILESSPAQGTMQAGTTWRQVVKSPFGKAEAAEAIERCTAFEENVQFAQACPSPMPHGGEYSFVPVPSGTQLTLRGHVELRGPMKVLKPLVARMVRRAVDKDLATLKEVLER